MAAVACFFTFGIRWAAGTTCEPHRHPCLEVVWTAETSGRVVHEGVARQYGPRQVIVHPAHGLHHIENETTGVQLCLGATGCEADRLVYGVFEPTPRLETLLRDLHGDTGHADPVRALRTELLAGLVLVELHALVGSKPPQPSKALRLKEILDTEFKSSLDLRELATRLYLHPDYLRKAFKKEFGDAPLHYLLRKRVEYASALLLLTDLSVKETALRSGFENSYYFSRTFRKFQGSTPSEFRTRHRSVRDRVRRTGPL
jgi:AraC-like DNA-binding protein